MRFPVKINFLPISKTGKLAGEEGFPGNAPLKALQRFRDAIQITVFDKKLSVFSG